MKICGYCGFPVLWGNNVIAAENTETGELKDTPIHNMCFNKLIAENRKRRDVT